METHLLLPDALHARHCLIESVDGFPAMVRQWPGHCSRPPALPSCPPPTLLCGVWWHEPPQPQAPQPPRSAAPRHGPWYVIPAGATSLLLFPPIDRRQCPSSMSLRAGWILQGTAPPDPHSHLCTESTQGHRVGLGWHWRAGEWDCRAVPGDLCPGVEVEGPHGAQHLNAPHVLRGKAVRADSTAGQAMERRGRVSGRRAFHTSSRDHTAAFALHPKTPHHMPRPRAKTPQTLCARACDAS